MATTAPPIPRVELAYAPTPLLKLERLSAELGTELWVKRDDLTGLLETGNKIRKLEFLVGEALAQNADTLITCGTLQSNSCRCVAAVCARLGLRAVLALKGHRPAEYDGNLLLDRLLGADIMYCSEAEREEIAQQARHGAPEFDTIAITDFSGGSQAGLLMAKQLTKLRADIVGIPIAWEAARVRAYVGEVIDRARSRFGLAVRPPAEVRLLDGYQGVGRAAVRRDELDTMLKLARLEGIVLDPVYTAKAFSGLLDTVRRDPRALGPRVCFVHTGGVFSVFPYRAALGRLVDGDGDGLVEF